MAERIESALGSRNQEIPALEAPGPPGNLPAKRRRRVLLWTAGILALVLAILGVAAQLAIDRVEPVLRARVTDALDKRFDSRVELDRFHVSVLRGFQAEGEGLRLYPRRLLTDQPLIAVARFRFRVSWTGLIETPMHIGRVFIEGMAINIPPKEQRLPPIPKTIPRTSTSAPAKPSTPSDSQPSLTGKIIVNEILIQDTRLLIGTSKPGKMPLDFEISRIDLHQVGVGRPMKFEATLVNPKPVGNIQSNGYFGPFRQDDPGESPVWGTYIFSHADLATFKGIGGILSSTGKYQGPLNRLTVDGQADVPDFRLNTGNHPMPLHTTFHAIVDGTSGDTFLQPVEAQLAHSHFTVTGSVVRVPAANSPVNNGAVPVAQAPPGPRGHNITLDVAMNNARIEDFLKLAVHTDPPVMNGNLRLNAKLLIPPGDVRVTDKIHLDGSFDVTTAHFGSDSIQKKIDELSRIGLGHPRDPDLHANFPPPDSNTPADVKGTFTLANARMDFPALDFSVPGADIDMAGIYTLDGSRFDFHGHAKLLARPSQMTTGWKSLLLRAVDPFLAKQGYGTVVPIEIGGTKSEPHFGLDFGHK